MTTHVQESWVSIPVQHTGWTFGHFFKLIALKIVIFFLKSPKINEKEAGVGQFKKTYFVPSYLNLAKID